METTSCEGRGRGRDFLEDGGDDAGFDGQEDDVRAGGGLRIGGEGPHAEPGDALAAGLDGIADGHLEGGGGRVRGRRGGWRLPSLRRPGIRNLKIVLEVLDFPAPAI